MASKKKAKTQPKYAMVSDPGGDWHGFYIDGKLVRQNHSLEPEDLLSLCGIEVVQLEADDEWMASEGQLPPDLSDVKLSDN